MNELHNWRSREHVLSRWSMGQGLSSSVRLQRRALNHWFAWKFQRRAVRIRNRFPAAKKGFQIEVASTAGFIACDRAVVRLIQASKIEVVAKESGFVEQPPKLWNIKGRRPRMRHHDVKRLILFVSLLQQIQEILRGSNQFSVRVIIVVQAKQEPPSAAPYVLHRLDRVCLGSPKRPL